MKIVSTIWKWMSPAARAKDEYKNDMIKELFESAMREVSYLGYHYVENFRFSAPPFYDSPEEMIEIQNKYDCKLLNLYHHFLPTAEEDYIEVEKAAKFLERTGGESINIQCPVWRVLPYERPFDKEIVDDYIIRANKIADICASHGLTVALHPHANSNIFHADHIEYFVDHVDTSKVKLCLDTAHLQLGGMDPIETIDKYGDIIGYMHLKDIDPDDTLNPEWPMKRFRALGQGCIDFRAMLKTLRKHNYDGSLSVELDYPVICNYQSAQWNREYIRNVLNL